MNLTSFDWSIVFIVLALMILSVVLSKRYMKSVADFLVAGRSAGRYVISVSSGVAGLGAITIVGNMEMTPDCRVLHGLVGHDDGLDYAFHNRIRLGDLSVSPNQMFDSGPVF